MMQAVEVYACIPHGFSMKRNHAGRHYLMPVLWNPSVSGFRCCKVYKKICKKPCSKLTEFCQYAFKYQGNSVNEHALKNSVQQTHFKLVLRAEKPYISFFNASDTMELLVRGIMIWRNLPGTEQPSMFAASSRSMGRPSYPVFNR